MARTPVAVTPKTIASTSITNLGYTVPTSVISTAFLVLTNASSSILEIKVFINDGTTSFIFCTVKIPAGVGKKKRIIALPDEKLSAGMSIEVQATTTDTFNAFLSISEISDN